MFKRRSQFLGFACGLQDLVLTALAFPVAYWLRAHVLSNLAGRWLEHAAIYPLRDYWPLLIGILIVWPVAGYVTGIYREVELRDRRQVALDVAKLVAVGLVALNAGLYLFKAVYVSRSFVLTIGAVDFVLLMAGRWFLLSAGSWLRDKLERYHYFLIVGTGPEAHQLAALIEEGEALGLRLIGFVHPDTAPPASLLSLRRSYPVLPLGDMPTILHNQVVDEVLFAVDKEELRRLEALILLCEQEGVKTRVQLDFLPRTFSQVYVENFRHVPLLTFGSTPDDELKLFAKRIVDFILSAVALVLLSPLLLILALLIRLTSPGPILYRQIRCGLGGRRFTLYKFRSMVANADKLRTELEALNEVDGPVFKLTDDPRCTPLGRWLRKISFDELPQLWNILRGDMSFVGPRPPLPEEVEKYESWQRRRLRMRPGLTCLWTLEGRSRLSFDRWIRLDLAYIDNWSLFLDFKILLKSIPLVVFGRGAS
jgi:exopolysaccharide biosynthesis polyprenyl glycosylphosphotransferase